MDRGTVEAGSVDSRIKPARPTAQEIVLSVNSYDRPLCDPFAAGRKSVANIGEPVCISFAMPALALLRIILARKLSERVYATHLS
jgi:hypothetical protein